MGIIQFKTANCRNCYKCLRYCPVKSISFKDGHANVVDDKCILCGRCVLVCPQNAKHVQNDLEKAKSMIASKKKVYVSLAPSYVASFPEYSFSQISSVLKKLGFTRVEETAIGASHVSREYDKLIESGTMKNIITTCCYSVVMMIERYYKELVPYLAPVLSPMSAHGKIIKEVYGEDVKTVFIGPCVSKKYEAKSKGYIDCALTFKELKDWIKDENVVPDENSEAVEVVQTVNRLYPSPGGILETLKKKDSTNYKHVAIDGMSWCTKILDDLLNDKTCSRFFIEMSARGGSCIEGPIIDSSVTRMLRSFLTKNLAEKKTLSSMSKTEEDLYTIKQKYYYKNINEKYPSELDIKQILEKIGKTSKETEYNCGVCGYRTCREKAIAVYQGHATKEMCLPYLQEKAESMANMILDHTPNGIFVIDSNLLIMDFNAAAHKILGLDKNNSRNMPIDFILPGIDTDIFKNLKEVKSIDCFYDTERDIYLQLTIAPLQEEDYMIMARDVTKEKQSRKDIEKLRAETLQIVQSVVDKQMRAAQEIASLLGETTGETKVAFIKLKKSIQGGDINEPIL